MPRTAERVNIITKFPINKIRKRVKPLKGKLSSIRNDK